MLLSDFDFALPEELIAQEPLADRAASRMLQMDRRTQQFTDRAFRDFPELLREGDLLVFNNTRVFPARLYGRRSGFRAMPVSTRNASAKEFLTGRVEVLLTQQVGEWEWQALVRPGRKVGAGERITFGEGELVCEVIARGEFGERTVRFDPAPDFFAVIERLGHVPLPPYISREDRSADRERYQTVYARERGSVAAPTAGLHFTPEILQRLADRGVERAEITLHVGLGTFQPLRSEVIEQNKLHRERYNITDQAALTINRALQDKRRIIAIGTTSVRTLEYVAQRNEGKIIAGADEAELFIYPGFEFRVVGAMLTNFHLPQSSLLMLVAAFAGRELTLKVYGHAVEQRYRFFSYGDCMFVE